MNTETTVAPDAETQNPASDPVQTAELTEQQNGAAEQKTEDEADPVKALEQRLEKERQRFDRRINRKHAEAAQANERARQLEARLAALEAPKAQESATDVDIDEVVTQRAEQLAKVREVAGKSNQAYESGLKEFGDAFKASIAEVIDSAGALIDKNQLPTPLGEAILDSDKPHQLLHYLGQNPDIAESLQGLSPTKLGRAIDRIERDMETARVSKAPAPLKPVTPKGAPATKAESEMTDAEWYAQRRKR